MSHTCHAHVTRMSHTCHAHVTCMSCTRHTHVMHMSCTRHTHVMHTSHTCHAHVTRHTHVTHMSCTRHTHVMHMYRTVITLSRNSSGFSIICLKYIKTLTLNSSSCENSLLSMCSTILHNILLTVNNFNDTITVSGCVYCS